jgi:serine/threonine protein kinase
MTVADEDASDVDMLKPGSKLPGGHEVVEFLTRDRFNIAYVVRGPEGERRAASVLQHEQSSDLGTWFASTAALRKEISHPHMPRTILVSQLEDGRPVEVAELLEGESLRDAVANRSVPLPFPVIARIVREVASALDHLHTLTPPVVHRAVTPENVVLTAPDGTVKLLGIGEADRPRFEAVRPAYQSPEALAEVSSLSPRADCYSLATLAFEALTGHPAFSGTPDEVRTAMHAQEKPRASDTRIDVPSAVDEIIWSGWDLSPDKRPRTAGEFARVFSTALGVDETGEIATRTSEAHTGSVRVVNQQIVSLEPVDQLSQSPIDSRSFLARVETTEVSTNDLLLPVDEPTSSMSTSPIAAPVPATPRRVVSERNTLRSTKFRADPPRAPRLPLPEPPGEETPRIEELPPRSLQREEVTNPVVSSRPEQHTVTAELSPAQDPVAVAVTTSPFQEDPRATLQTTTDAIGLVLSASGEAPVIHEPSNAVVHPPVHVLPVNRPSPLPPPEPRPLPATLGTVTTPATPFPMAAPAETSPVPVVLSTPSVLPPAQLRMAPERVKRPRTQRAPDDVGFPDEPTTTISTVATPSPWRSPWVIASIFFANALIIVGIAHAIALAANQEPLVRVVQAPPAVCAPCAACAACPVCVQQPVEATPRSVAVSRTLIPTPRPPIRRNTGVIREVPVFGNVRR